MSFGACRKAAEPVQNSLGAQLFLIQLGQIGKALGGSVGGQFGKTLGGNVGASLGRGILKTLFKL